MPKEEFRKLVKPTREMTPVDTLIDTAPDWQRLWWGMPTFTQKDARPRHRIVVNFLTTEDIAKFAEALGIKITEKADSIWFPFRERLNGEFVYDGPKTDSKYPVCLPSKGRATLQTTGKLLEQLGVTHRFFVEKHEYREYCNVLGKDRVVRMPFKNLGEGSIPARNFIWEWAKENGYKRHWVVDDNIRAFGRTHMNRRLIVKGGGFFRAMEDFVDRYENIAMAGPHNKGFIDDANPNIRPFTMNSRVYSCILIDTALPFRWRGRYNEDTDLSLRCLKERDERGRPKYCTLLFNALHMDKGVTHGAKGKAMSGGNTDNVYNTGDNRMAFAKSLQEQHPDIVQVTWKFNRWHHEVDYTMFKRNTLVLREGVTPIARDNDYGMELRRVKGNETSGQE